MSAPHCCASESPDGITLENTRPIEAATGEEVVIGISFAPICVFRENE